MPDLAETAISRQWVREYLAVIPVAVPTLTALDVVQVADLLVANAIRHGAGQRRLRLTQTRSSLYIEVMDASTAPAVTSLRRAANGRDLILLDELTLAWGQIARMDGKTVWARMLLDKKLRSSAHYSATLA